MKELPEILTHINIDNLPIPKWIKEKIHNIKRERDMAIRNLVEYINADNDETPIYYEDWVFANGKHKSFKKYLKVGRITVSDGKISATIYIDNYHHITVNLNDEDHRYEFAMQPNASNSITFKAIKREDMA